MIPQHRLQNLQTRNKFFERHGNRQVLIRSGQWGAWWRPGRKGYTDDRSQAGVYTLIDAFDASGHCGPEKEIYYEFLPKKAAPSGSTIREAIEIMAQSFPITWDRFTEEADGFNIYGWIERSDGKRDFVLLLSCEIDSQGLNCGFVTSSAKYSSSIYLYLYGDAGGELDHAQCQKIETLNV